MRCYRHPETTTVDTCPECGREICPDCSILINDRVTCKACIEHEIDRLMIMPKFKTIKETSLRDRPIYLDVIRHPDIAIGVFITAMLMLATLYVCMSESLVSYTPYMALVMIFAIIAIVYDIQKVINQA